MTMKAIRQWIAGSVVVGLGMWGTSASAAIASSSAPGSHRVASPESRSMLFAQRANTCRQADVQIGIYQEPNVTSPAVGVVEARDYILLGSGSGGGWVRITAPAIGWVEARYLLGSDSTPCPSDLRPSSPNTVNPPEIEEPDTDSPEFPPPGQPASSPEEVIVEEPDAPEPLVTRTAVCRVTPQSGLVVRSRPLILSATAINTLPAGIQTIEFTDRTVTTETVGGQRQWVYIVSPVEGWISPGFVGDTTNLVGVGCSVS